LIFTSIPFNYHSFDKTTTQVNQVRVKREGINGAGISFWLTIEDILSLILTLDKREYSTKRTLEVLNVLPLVTITSIHFLTFLLNEWSI